MELTCMEIVLGDLLGGGFDSAAFAAFGLRALGRPKLDLGLGLGGVEGLHDFLAVLDVFLPCSFQDLIGGEEEQPQPLLLLGGSGEGQRVHLLLVVPHQFYPVLQVWGMAK